MEKRIYKSVWFRLFAVVLTLCVALTVSAKKNPVAELKVTYNYHHLVEKSDGGVSEKNYPMVLLANTVCSKFYSPRSEYLDSLESTPAGKKLSDQMFDAAIQEYVKTKNRSVIPSYNGQLYLFKSAADSTVTVYDSYDFNAYAFYSEPLAEMNWEIGDSVKNVLGYECLMASTDYHGRQWTVWFTLDIPLQDGPWKLCGLPGLILEASESTGQHSFTAEGLETGHMEIFPIYNKHKYEKMKRKDMLKANRAYMDNRQSRVNAVLKNSPSGETYDIIPIVPRKENNHNIDFLETDYR